MLKYCFLLFTLSTFSQTDSLLLAKKDSIYKSKAISFYSDEIYSTTIYKNTATNTAMGSATSRSIRFNFKVGNNSVINIGRKGKNLRDALKDDHEAIAELNKAYKYHLRKKRINNTLEYVSYLVAFGSFVPFFIGITNDNDPANALTIGGGAGVVAGWVGIYYFKNRTNKHMDNFAYSLRRSVEIYNTNLFQKTR